MEHRALRHQAAAEHDHPKAWRQIDRLREAHEKGHLDWPNWIYLPMAPTIYMVADTVRISKESMHDTHPRYVPDASRLAAVAAWRITKGIYRFDPPLLSSVARATFAADLHAAILPQLPAWCVYIETPGIHLGSRPVEGFFAHLDGDREDGPTRLHLALDINTSQGTDLLHLALDIRDRPLAEVATDLGCLTVAARRIVGPSGPASTLPPDLFMGLPAFLKLVVFLCSEQADIRSDNGLPARLQPAHASGQRLEQPAPRPTFWLVGSVDDGASPRPRRRRAPAHFRKALQFAALRAQM